MTTVQITLPDQLAQEAQSAGLLTSATIERMLRERRVALFTSTPLLAELTNILGRHKFDKKIAASMLSIDPIVDRYAELAVLVRPAAVQEIITG